MILPAFGIISESWPTFARKPLFGATSMIYAIASIRIPVVHRSGAHMFATACPCGAIVLHDVEPC